MAENDEEITTTEQLFNEAIMEGVEIIFEEMSLEEARNTRGYWIVRE
jgi:alanyl-tRNA synthetase